MKVTQLIFFLVVALLLVATTFLPEYKLTTEIALSRSQSWRLGFGQTTVGLATLLVVAAVYAWRGTALARHICVWWGGLYAVLVGGLGILHFPDSALQSVLYGPIFGAVWVWGVDHLLVKPGE